ncbi:MAG: hypothetical protein KDB01_22310, partial [Planctomycetaceae bacterium]|nr:hypothetical protein [Planctomycetaceae bacterium]
MHYSSRHSGLNRHLRVFVITVLVFSSASWHLTAADEGQDLFEQRIRPLLLEKCIECHGPGKQENGVRLDRR